MASKICQYENNGVKCKNWVVSAKEDPEEKVLCPLHSGVMKREPSKEELLQQQRFDNHFAIANMMSNEQLAAHILQLESLLEDVKLRQQAAASVKSKRIKEANNGQLTEEEKAEITKLRGERPRKSSESAKEAAPKLSKEEKEIQKLMKLGFSREKAVLMLGMD